MHNNNNVGVVANVAPNVAYEVTPHSDASHVVQSTDAIHTARALKEWELSDIILVATIDGGLYARDRATGTEVWSVTGNGPLVKVFEHQDEYEEHVTWVVEPLGEGTLYYFTQTDGMRQLPLSIEKLVQESPFALDGKVYTGTRKTTLFAIDTQTGEIVQSFGGDLSGVRTEREDEPEYGSNASGVIMIGRTQYDLSIYRQGASVWNVTYSTWGPNNRDIDLARQHSVSMDNLYVTPFHEKLLVGVETTLGYRPHWETYIPSCVINVFDILKDKRGESDDGHGQDVSNVLLPQPRVEAPQTGPVPAIYVHQAADGGYFAISEHYFPYLVKSAPLSKWSTSSYSSYPADRFAQNLPDIICGVHDSYYMVRRVSPNKDELLLLQPAGSQALIEGQRYEGVRDGMSPRFGYEGQQGDSQGSDSEKSTAGFALLSLLLPLLESPITALLLRIVENILTVVVILGIVYAAIRFDFVPPQVKEIIDAISALRKGAEISERELEREDRERVEKRDKEEKEKEKEPKDTATVVLDKVVEDKVDIVVDKVEEDKQEVKATEVKEDIKTVEDKEEDKTEKTEEDTKVEAVVDVEDKVEEVKEVKEAVGDKEDKEGKTTEDKTTEEDKSTLSEEFSKEIVSETSADDVSLVSDSQPLTSEEASADASAPSTPSTPKVKFGDVTVPDKDSDSESEESNLAESITSLNGPSLSKSSSAVSISGMTPKKRKRGSRGGRRNQKNKDASATDGVITSPNSAADLTQVAAEKSGPIVIDNSIQTLSQPVSEQADDIQFQSSVLVVSKEIIGKGSHGTIVYKGTFENREVAVKRMLVDNYDVASHEVSLLQESDDHPNVIRYYCKQQNNHFLYIALEWCPGTLEDVFEDSSDKFPGVKENMNHVTVLEQIAEGVKYLHSLKIVHRDIKPQNILVAPVKKRRAKKATPDDKYAVRMLISDFGLCKRLENDQSSFRATTANGGAGTSGWRAPEVLNDDSNRRATRALDIFSLGCVFYYVLTGGSHPFGDRYLKESNIIRGIYNLDALDEAIPHLAVEARDLITHMISRDPSQRPSAEEVVRHPMFWNHKEQLDFLLEVSDRFEIEPRDPPSELLMQLERDAPSVVGSNWQEQLDPLLLENLGKYRKYHGDRVMDLLRAFRNKYHHFNDMPPELQKLMLPLPRGYMEYFTSRFPNLLMSIYYVVKDNLRHDHAFERFFDDH
ncbi:Serine/threonine-protein kinase ppk4 [Yarrowia sp. C11]|nr:Serine/threonine-protein kinase ppk4 [Yarrowia sp. E02]KAG5369773.1 Serine/threonine-protein kinase ppk4 [Yarrowia sp. C11]